MAEIALGIQLPAARVELAVRDGKPGIISGRISGEQELTLGNEILERLIPGYDPAQRHGVEEYTIDAIFEAFDELSVRPPPGSPPGPSAKGIFAEYLTLDALVANTDRHHENWGIIRDPEAHLPAQLAPSFDHASSLAFLLSDEKRSEILADQATRVPSYCRKGQSRHFRGEPALVELAKFALESLPSGETDRCRNWLREPLDDLCGDVIQQVPPARMSQPARTLALEIVRENHRRLKDELKNHG